MPKDMYKKGGGKKTSGGRTGRAKRSTRSGRTKK